MYTRITRYKIEDVAEDVEDESCTLFIRKHSKFLVFRNVVHIAYDGNS